MAKICMNCGNQCKEEAGFCPYCGAKFSTVNDLQRNYIPNQGMNSNMVMQNRIPPQNTSLHQNKTGKYIVIALLSMIAIVVLCGVIFLAYYLGASDKNSSETTTQSETVKDQDEEEELKNQSNDQCQLSSLQMDINSTIAVTTADVQDTTVELSELGNLVSDDQADEFVSEFLVLRGKESVDDYREWLSLKSELALDEDGADGRVFVSADSATGTVCVFMTENHDPDGEKIEKLTIASN